MAQVQIDNLYRTFVTTIAPSGWEEGKNLTFNRLLRAAARAAAVFGAFAAVLRRKSASQRAMAMFTLWNE